MFEAVVAVCLNLAEPVCRDQLLPGYEAETREACERRLLDTPPGRIAGANPDERPTCQPVGPALEFQEVGDGVFVHVGHIAEPDTANRGDASNIGFIIGDDSVAVIDTGSAPWMGEALWRAIRLETEKPVSHVILTHVHPDHVLGSQPLIMAGARVAGHAELDRALLDRWTNYLEGMGNLIGANEYAGLAPFSSDLSVKEETLIDLGHRRLLLRAWPTAHTASDLTVLDEHSGILFAGDLVFHRHLPALDGRLMGWQAVLAELADMDIRYVVPGHGGPVLDWPVGSADMMRYLSVLEHDTRAAIDKGLRLGEAVDTIARGEVQNWELFEAYNPRNATVAFTELEWE